MVDQFEGVLRAHRNRLRQFKQLSRRYWQLGSPYWFSDEKWNALGILLLLIVLIVSTTSLSGILNELSGKFITALSNKETNRFYQLLLWTTGVVMISFGLEIIKGFTISKLGLYWREWLTKQFLQGYFTKYNFYQINNSKDIDNPDQRISEDIRTFVDQNYLIISLIETTSRGFLFIGILASVNVSLVFFACGAAILQIILTFTIGRILTQLNYQNLQKQADFRYGLVQARDHSELIALYGGEGRELGSSLKRFQAAMRVLHQMVLPASQLNAFKCF